MKYKEWAGAKPLPEAEMKVNLVESIEVIETNITATVGGGTRVVPTLTVDIGTNGIVNSTMLCLFGTHHSRTDVQWLWSEVLKGSQVKVGEIDLAATTVRGRMVSEYVLIITNLSSVLLK